MLKIQRRLKSVMIVSQGYPPFGRYLAEAFSARGVKASVLCTDLNTWFDKWVIHTVNKQLHNLKLLPKQKSLLVNHRWAHRNYLDSKFRSQFKKEQPDMVFAIRGATYCEQSIKESGSFSFGWWVEPGNRAHEVFAELKNFEWYYSMNTEGLDRFRGQGFEACSYMPHMFSATEFFPMAEVEKTIDLVFVGKWTPRRQVYLDAALEVTNSVVLYGEGWLSRNWTNLKYWKAWKGCLVKGAKLNRLYNRAKVVLNITQWGSDASQPTSGMNMRFFEVPATESLLMSDHVEEAESIFQEGQDYLCFGETQDLKNKLQQILQDSEKRMQIARNGYMAVQNNNASYDRLVVDVIERFASLQQNKCADI